MAFEYPIAELELSHSTMGSFHSCERKLEFAKFYGFNLRTRSLAGDGGSAIHEAVGEYLVTRDRDAATWVFLKEFPIDLQTQYDKPWNIEYAYSALLSLFNWVDEHPEYELAKIGDKLAIEVPFLIRIEHGIEGFVPVIYRGFIDFIFYDRLNDVYEVLDLKNTTAKSSDFTVKYKYDGQCLPYGLILKRALDENLNEMVVKYLVQKVAIEPDAPQFLEFQKTQQDINEWAQDMYMDLKRMSVYAKTNWFPRRSSGCMNFNRACQYFELCATRDSNTISLMLGDKDQPKMPFDPWITLNLELSGV